MEHTPEQIEKAMDNMPENLNRAIDFIDVEKNLMDVKEKYSLHLDVIDKIHGEIMLALIGLSRPDELPAKIRTTLADKDETTKNQIVNGVNENIFRKVKDRFMYLENLDREAEEARAEVEEEKKAELAKELEDSIPVITDPAELEAPVVVPVQVPVNIMTEKKLSEPFRIAKQETDYSAPSKLPPLSSAPKYERHDPYLEPIE